MAFGLTLPARSVLTSSNGAVVVTVDVFGSLPCVLFPRAQVLQCDKFRSNETPESDWSRSCCSQSNIPGGDGRYELGSLQ